VSFSVKLFTIKGNLVMMNNLYLKVVVTSVGTVLSFTLGANKEAKAATFTLTGTTFVVEGNWSNNSAVEERILDSEDYPSSNGLTLFTDGAAFSGRNGPTERRAFYEFNIGNLPLAPNTMISRASFDTALEGVKYATPRYLYLQIFGYVGNGEPNLSDFNAGIKLGFANALNPFTLESSHLPRIRSSIDFDVTQFVKARVSNSDAFAGFGLRIEDFAANYGTATLVNPRLTIETADLPEPVPEPTTIFGSALALGVGGWLKRKKLSQHSKTTSKH
jgi:hypothetical protein